MRESGVISKRDYADAIATPVPLAPPRHDPYAAASDSLSWRPYDVTVTQQFGAEDVLKGGLRIYTTIDMKL